jgi:hypothetical protein
MLRDGTSFDGMVPGWQRKEGWWGPRLRNLFWETRASERGNVTRLLLKRACLLCPEFGLLFNTSYNAAASDNVLFSCLPSKAWIAETWRHWHFLRCGLLCVSSAFTLVSCFAYSSTMKTEATCSSETSVDFQRTTQCYIAEDRTLHTHRCENLKSYMS